MPDEAGPAKEDPAAAGPGEGEIENRSTVFGSQVEFMSALTSIYSSAEKASLAPKALIISSLGQRPRVSPKKSLALKARLIAMSAALGGAGVF